jgi:hypothetical protein
METWAVMFGNNALAITPGEIQVRPGLGRHRLVVPISVRPTTETAYGHSVSFSGSVSANGLRGVGGYLGRIDATTPRQINPNSLVEEYLHFDIDLRQIATIESVRDGGFTLDLQIEIIADAGSEHGSAHVSGHEVSRETWLRVLEQIQYQKTLLLELPIPNPQSDPHLSKAISYFVNAQRRFLEGANRSSVEELRQCLAALVSQDPNLEDDSAVLTGDLKTARFGGAKFDERFDLVRRALKLTTDLAAHPEVAETGPAEARATIVMVAGLLQWFTAP